MKKRLKRCERPDQFTVRRSVSNLSGRVGVVLAVAAKGTVGEGISFVVVDPATEDLASSWRIKFLFRLKEAETTH